MELLPFLLHFWDEPGSGWNNLLRIINLMMEALDKQLSLARGKMGSMVALERDGKRDWDERWGVQGYRGWGLLPSPNPRDFQPHPTPLHPGDGKEQERGVSTRILPSHGI